MTPCVEKLNTILSMKCVATGKHWVTTIVHGRCNLQGVALYSGRCKTCGKMFDPIKYASCLSASMIGVVDEETL